MSINFPLWKSFLHHNFLLLLKFKTKIKTKFYQNFIRRIYLSAHNIINHKKMTLLVEYIITNILLKCISIYEINWILLNFCYVKFVFNLNIELWISKKFNLIKNIIYYKSFHISQIHTEYYIFFVAYFVRQLTVELCKYTSHSSFIPKYLPT